MDTDSSDELLRGATDVNSSMSLNIREDSRFNPDRTGTSIVDPSVIEAHSETPEENECTRSQNSAINSNDKTADCLREHKNGLRTTKDEIVPHECPVSGRRSDEVPSQNSLRDGPPINVESAFEVGGEAEAKKTSNVYTGEGITVCWIELTTIREDTASSPPKKLVIREFAISFENSDTIPEKDMDCSRIRGEISPGEEKTVCESSLNEMVVDDTKRSRVVEFAKDSQDGSISIRQYKKVKCATGSVVSKTIYEWPDGTDDPKKRVEIKVAPSVQKVRSEKDGEPSLCAPEGVVADSPGELTSTASSECPTGESCEQPSISCEDTGTCNGTRTSTSCEDGTCISTSLPEESLSTSNSLEPEQAAPSPLKNVGKVLKSPKVSPPDSDADEIGANCTLGDCAADLVDDPEGVEDCSQADCNTESSNDVKSAKNCSQEDCAAESSDETPGDVVNDSASLCKNGNCTSEEDSTTSQEGNAVTEENEECPEGSESCDCTASSCLGDATQKPNSLSAEDKVTEETATLSGEELPRIPHNDTACDSESEKCSSSPISSSEREDTTVASLPISDNNEMTGEVNDAVPGMSSEEMSDADESVSTTDTASTEILSGSTGSVCQDAASQDCVTVGPTPFDEITEQLTVATTEYSPTTENSMPLATTEGNPMIPEAESSEAEEPPCKEDSTGKNCETTGSRDPTISQVVMVPSKLPSQSADASRPTSSQNLENNADPVTSPFTPKPMTTGESEILMIHDSIEVPDNLTVSDEETSTNEDSSIETTAEALENVAVTTEPCDPSEDCDTTRATQSSTKLVESASLNPATSTGSFENKNCNNSSEPCVNASSTASCEDCDDESSDEDCGTNESSEQIGSEELADNTTTEASVTINNVSETTETRRTTVASALPQEPEGKHKLALRIKVLLEHINDKEEKEKLVQLEKHLLLDEMLDQHGNHSLIWHLKSLNNSMNIETFKSIFNLTDLDNLTEIFSHVTEFNEGGLKRMATLKTQDDRESKSKKTSSRAKRDISKADKTVKKGKNSTDAAKAKAIKESLPGVNEDFQKGLGHVLGGLSHELNGGAPRAANKIAESSTSTIMKILADPGDKRIHSRRQKRATNVKDMSIEGMKHPVNGKDTGRWSNERFVMAGDGGRVRSLLEFEIMRDPSYDLRRIHLGS